MRPAPTDIGRTSAVVGLSLLALVVLGGLVPPTPAPAARAQATTPACQQQREGDWTRVALPEPAADDLERTDMVAVDPNDATRVLVAGQVLYRSEDGGCTWDTPLDPPTPLARVTGVAVSPHPGATILVRVREAPVPDAPDRIHRSTDGGRSFEPAGTLASGGTARATISISSGLVFAGPTAPDVVYALSNGTDGFGIDRSDDGGRTWTQRALLPSPTLGLLTGQETPRPARGQEVRLAVDPADPDRVWLKDTQTPPLLFLSTDGARTFEAVDPGMTPDERVARGNDGVATVALPGGTTRVVVFEEYDDQAAATTESLRYTSDDGGRTFTVETLPTPPYSVREQVVGPDPEVELVTARSFSPNRVPGTKVLRRDGDAGWVDVSLPDLGHLEQLQGSVDPATGRTVAWGLGDGALWRYDGPLDGPTDAAPGGAVEARRLAGPERIATGIAVSRDQWPDGAATTATLARADAFPDAVAGSPLAVAAGGPLLLTAAGGLSDATAAELQRVLPDGATVRLLGGPAALGPEVATDVAALGFTVDRVQGPSRFETAVAIARAATSTPAVVLLADGTTFPDALVAGAAAAAVGGTVVLTAGDQPHPASEAYLADHPAVPVIAVGAIAQAAHPDAQALGGADPVATAVAVAARFATRPAAVALASAATFPDGLTGGTHAGRAGMPLLLTPPDRLDPATAGYLRGLVGLREVVVYGGRAAVAEEVVEAASAR